MIGRSEPSPGNLGGDPSLSRRHARVHVVGEDRVAVEDLGSTNGTAVNGEVVRHPRLLSVGDKIEVGDSTLELVATGAEGAGAAAAPPGAFQPLGDVLGPAAAATPPAPATGGKRSALVPVLGVLVVLLAVAAIIGFATGGDDDEGGSTAAQAGGPEPAGWLYVVSNRTPGETNSVLAIDYYEDGLTTPMRVREFATKGEGVRLIPGKSFGTVAGDTQVTISPDKRFLFAVNQGSDTIAVFRIDADTGSLEHVPGSPFPSGGKAPVATGFNGRHLVVVNHGIVPGEEPPGDPQRTNYATFAVSDEGALKPVDAVPAPGSGPTAAVFAPNDRVVFGAEFYGASLNSFVVDTGAGSGPRRARLRSSPTTWFVA